MHALHVHGAAFGVLPAGKITPWGRSKAALDMELASYYHDQAFVQVVQPKKGKRGDRRR